MIYAVSRKLSSYLADNSGSGAISAGLNAVPSHPESGNQPIGPPLQSPSSPVSAHGVGDDDDGSMLPFDLQGTV